MIYIVIDGTDGTGKTTFSEKLCEALSPQVTRVKFPTRYPTEKDREWPTQAALFYLNDFEETLQECREDGGILYRGEGGVLVCDRSFLSTLAYQGFEDFFSPVKSKLYDAIFEFGSHSFFDFMGEDDRAILVRLTCDVEEAYRRVTDRLNEEDAKDEIDALEEEERLRAMKSLQMRYDFMFDTLFGDLRERFSDPKLDVVTYDTTHTEADELVEKFLSEMFES